MVLLEIAVLAWTLKGVAVKAITALATSKTAAYTTAAILIVPSGIAVARRAQNLSDSPLVQRVVADLRLRVFQTRSASLSIPEFDVRTHLLSPIVDYCCHPLTNPVQTCYTSSYTISMMSTGWNYAALHTSWNLPLMIAPATLPHLLPMLIITGTVAVIHFYVEKYRSLEAPPTKQRLTATFRNIRLHEAPPVNNTHSHAIAARARNSADLTICLFIKSQHYQPYSVQMSSRDVLSGINGSLFWFWLRDTDTGYERRDHYDPTKHIIKMINVDYYVNWKHFLTGSHTFLLYTFTPSSSAGKTSNYTWCTNSDNTVTMSVQGGGKYTHELWDYSVDQIVNVSNGYTWVYKVETVRLTTNSVVNKTLVNSDSSLWSIVLITFVNKLRTPLELNKLSLVRRKLAFPKFAMTKYQTARGVKFSVSHFGDTVSTKIKSAIITSVVAKVKSQKIKVDLHTVTNVVQAFYLRRTHEDESAKIKFETKVARVSTMLFMIHEALPEFKDVSLNSMSTSTAQASTALASGPIEVLYELKVSGRVLFPPIIPGGSIPTRCIANDRWCLTERVTKPRNETPYPMKYHGFIQDFIDYITTDLTPLTLEDVYKRQERPSQRVRNDHAAHSVHVSRGTIKSFQKAEPYPKATSAPRNISTVDNSLNYRYSRFTLALADHLKQFPWYGFSKHPNVVAERVQYIATLATFCLETDFSKFDGHHNQMLYDIEYEILLRCFPTFANELEDLIKNVGHLKGITMFNIKYSIFGSRISGCPDTSIMNTIINALVAYVCFRVIGLRHDQAIATLGIYGGDDGITPGTDTKVYERTAKDFGLKLTATVRDLLEPLSFLGRVYPCPRTSLTSICDPIRHLAKINLTCSNGYTDASCLRNKAEGYLITDRNTPLISELAHFMLRVSRKLEPNSALNVNERNYFSRQVSLFEAQLVDDLSYDTKLECISKLINVDSDAIRVYISKIDDWKDLSDVEPLYIVDEIPIAENTIYGDLVGPINLQTINERTDLPHYIDNRVISQSEVPGNTTNLGPERYPPTLDQVITQERDSAKVFGRSSDTPILNLFPNLESDKSNDKCFTLIKCPNNLLKNFSTVFNNPANRRNLYNIFNAQSSSEPINQPGLLGFRTLEHVQDRANQPNTTPNTPLPQSFTNQIYVPPHRRVPTNSQSGWSNQVTVISNTRTPRTGRIKRSRKHRK